jgi:hypothetical protein
MVRYRGHWLSHARQISQGSSFPPFHLPPAPTLCGLTSHPHPPLTTLPLFLPPKTFFTVNNRPLSVRASSTPAVDVSKTFDELSDSCSYLQSAPPVEQKDLSKPVAEAYGKLASAGAIPKWGKVAAAGLNRRNVFPNELTRAGLKNPERLAIPSVRNDAAFLFSVVATTSVLAVAASTLPGDWGFFSSYLIGGISLVVLAIGSVNPGLLQVAINTFSTLFPDFRERILRHESAHFLVAYLLGLPVCGYNLDLGREQTALVEAKLQARLFERNLEDTDIDILGE